MLIYLMDAIYYASLVPSLPLQFFSDCVLAYSRPTIYIYDWEGHWGGNGPVNFLYLRELKYASQV